MYTSSSLIPIPSRTAIAAVLCALLAGLLGAVPPAAAQQEVSVSASADPATAGTGDVITYTIEVKGATLSSVQTPEPPPTTNLVLRQSTPSTQRNLSFQSGEMSRSIAFRWEYRPMREGIARIRETDVVVSGQTFTTSEIRIKVVPHSQSPSASAGPHGTSRKPGEGQRDTADVLGPRDLFIRATASTDQVYRGEQATVEYRLYFRPGIQLRHSRLASAWDANGFWREELDVASRPVPKRERVDGREYRTIVLKRVAIFPTRAGDLNVDPLRIETEAYVSAASRRPEGRYSLRSRYEPVTLASDGLSLAVRALPDGAPPSFDGAVGRFQLEARAGSDTARVGGAVRVRVTVRGDGNIATLSPPEVEVPSAFEVYDPNVEMNLGRGGDRIRGSKTFTYVLVPRENGRYTIPPVEFAYFDAESNTYETLRSRPVNLLVTGDAAPRAVSTTGAGLPVDDVAGIIQSDPGWMRSDAPPLYRQVWPYAVLSAPLLLAAGLLFLVRRRIDAADVPSARQAKAQARENLDRARERLSVDEPRPFYRILEETVLGYLAHRLGRPVSGLSRSRLDAVLTDAGVEPDTRDALRGLLDACDRARYTPDRPSHDAMQAALARTSSLLSQFDEQLEDGTSAARTNS